MDREKLKGKLKEINWKLKIISEERKESLKRYRYWKWQWCLIKDELKK